VPFAPTPAGLIEYERIDTASPGGLTFVMLHEGLGSVAMWRDFPQRLAQSMQSTVIAYSRSGYGRSERLHVRNSIRYMHDEALVVLPQFLDQLDIENPILFGHSDGGSIALIHAGGSDRPVAGVVALAPHVLVENISVASIAAAKHAYETTNLRERLANYHDDVDGVFWRWNDVWLDPAFRAWNIEEYLPRISCPVLAIQGEKDEYGTMDQVERIRRAAPEVVVLEVKECRHSPHRDQPKVVLDALAQWTRRYRLSETRLTPTRTVS